MVKVVVIGGGAGGILAAGHAAESGARVVLLERNSILGRKLRITGKGRGNVTNTADLQEFIAAFGKNGKFLYGAFSRFSNQDLVDLLKRIGVPTKEERGGRVFPKSDRASDVVAAFERWLRELHVDIRTGVRAQGLVLERPSGSVGGSSPHPSPLPKGEGVGGAAYDVLPSPQPSPSEGEGARETSPETRNLKPETEPAASVQPLATNHLPPTTPTVIGVRVFSGIIPADAVVLATGGITYPKTGSTGDGYKMAAEVGHTIVPPEPSLAALEAKEQWIPQLQGLSLRNVRATLCSHGKKVGQQFGEMLFTHFGVSGPIILTLSKTYAKLEDKSDVTLSINLKPAISPEELDERLISDFRQTKQYKNYLASLVPRTLIPVFARLSGIPAEEPINRITGAQRRGIVELLMNFRLTIAGALAVDEAIVTSGGVSIKEMDPRTMESKLVHGLFFAGEVVDIDAVTGGYNLQAAFSTGWVAGESAASGV